MARNSNTIRSHILLLILILAGLFAFSLSHTRISTTKAAITVGLVGYWTFDEGSGTTAADSSGNGNTGTLVNGPTWVAGKIGAGAIQFNGVSSTINAGSAASLDDIQNQGGGGMTVAFWINPSSNNFNTIISKGPAANAVGFWNITKSAETNPARLTFSKEGSPDMKKYYNSLLTIGVWQHIILTWNGSMLASGVNVYKNGVLVSLASDYTDGAAANSDAANNLSIGSSDGTADYFDGSLDDVRIYNRVLTTQEITDLYNYTGATPTPTPATDTTPPVISAGSPTGTLAVGTTSTTLSVTTNENATCKYGTVANTAYASIANTFTTTGTTSHSATITGLTNSTSYTYYVRCQDASGNADTADYSISFSVATPDTTVPSVPTGLTATAISSSQINLSWTASTDNVAVTGYKIYRGGTQIATSATTSYSDTGLTASTPYSYTVSAYDAAGNNSAQSTAASATTQAASTKRVDLLNSSGTVLNTYTTIQACANVVTAGQTCLVYAGTYDENVTLSAGSAGAYKTIQVNGDDLVYVLGFTLNSHNKLIGGLTARPTTTGLHIQNPANPRQYFGCVTIADGVAATDIFILNANFYACGSGGMISFNSIVPYPSYVYVQNNTFSYGASTIDSPDVGNAIHARGDHWLVENNDFSHLMQAWQRVGSYGVLRNNTFHDVYGRDLNNVYSQHDCITQLSPASNNPSYDPTATVSGSTVTWTNTNPNGWQFWNEAPGMWVKFNGGSTKYIIASKVSDTVITLQASPTPPQGAVTVQGGNGGNCHGEFSFAEPSSATQHTLIENNTISSSFGNDNKGFLFQADSCNGNCHNAIVRYNKIMHLGGGVLEDDAADPRVNLGFYHVKSYNNTWADVMHDILNSFGGASTFVQYSINGADVNDIFYFVGSTFTGINPYLCDNNSGLGPTCATFVGNHNLAYITGTGTLFGKVYEMGNFTDEPTNLNQDPKFANYAGNDFHLATGSPAIDVGTYLTTVATGDSGSGTSLVVNDASYFQDGYGISGVQPDCIAVGTVGNTACIAVSGINYATNAITLTSAITRTPGQPVYLYKKSDGTQVLYGTAPDIGAYEYVSSTPTPTPTPTPTDTTPPVISAINSSAITSSAATITWTTDEISDSQVEYGTTTSYGASTTLSTSLVTAHSVNLSALTANTLYHYRVKSKDAAGNLATSADNTFTTLANPPVISNIQATSIGATSATITWTTDKPSSSKVNYGLTSSYTTSTVKDTTLVTTHSVTLGSLNSSTIYHYQVESTDSGNLTTTSSDNTFTTTAPPSLPVISNIQSTNIITSGATITWTTDILSDSQVEYGLTTSYGTSTTLNSTLVTSHSVIISGLSSGTTYNYRVKSGGSVSINKTFSTPSLGTDTTPPAAISNLAVTNSTQTSINLSWTAPGNDGNIGTAASYQMRWYVLPITDSNWNTAIVLTGLPTPTSAGTTQTYSAIGLTANTTYYFALKTTDASGNVSSLSNVPSGKTLAYTASAAAGGSNGSAGSADTTPPNPPKLSRFVEADSQILLEWINPSDADFARVVIIERDDRFPGSATDGLNLLETDQTSYTVSNLKNGQTYYFAIFALDTAKNYSTPLLIKATPKEGILSFSKEAPSLAAVSTMAYIPSVTSTPSTPGQFTSPYPDGALIRYFFGKEVYYLENKIKRHISDYATLLKLTRNNPQKVIITPFKDALSDYADGQPVTGKDTSQINISPTLIRSKEGPQVYLIDEQSKTRKPIPTLAIFYSYGFSFNQVGLVDKTALDQYTDAASISFQLLPDSSLIKSKAEPKIYIIQNGQKRWLTAYNIFKAYKLNLNDVITLDNSVIAAYSNGQDVATTTESLPKVVSSPTPKPPQPVIPTYPDGTLLKGSSATLYFIESNQKRAFSSYTVFELLGYKQSNVKTIKDADLKLIPDGTAISSIQTHPNGTLIKLADDYRIYLIENGQIRHISSLDVFNTKGYSFDGVVTVSPQELGGYEVGEEVR